MRLCLSPCRNRHKPRRQRASGSFANLLASFTSKLAEMTAWDDSALADDVATITYEQALRASRRRPIS